MFSLRERIGRQSLEFNAALDINRIAFHIFGKNLFLMTKLFSVFAVIITLVFISCGSDDGPTVVADTEKPSAPLNLSASNISETSAQLTWDAATDNVGVVGYKLYENGTLTEENITATSFTVSSLLVETEYSYQVTAVDAAGNESSMSNANTFFTLSTPLIFETNLSEMGIFTGTLSDLTPAANVQLYELNSTLFTDYAAKQRLVRLPGGQKMEYNNSDLLPKFPDNTLIAKTFYYFLDDRDPALGKKIIETRVLIKVGGNWLAGNYIWNSAQTEATYRETGSEELISYIDSNGTTQNISYEIPSKADCFTCHNNDNTTVPIGMKLRSMNFTPSFVSQNQLAYLGSIGMLDGVDASAISVLPDWTDTNFDIFERGRAYIDINCAHCHQPGGPVTNFSLDFRLETAFDDSGIYANRGEIEARVQSISPTYRMPQLGRTIVHEEAVVMLLEYLDALD
jgi:uncharacterized repeat protein (TIGR03806 family)